MTWRSAFQTTKVVAVTAVITSLGWITAGAIYWPENEPVELAPAASPSMVRGSAAMGSPPANRLGDARPAAGAGVGDRALSVPVSGIMTSQLDDTFTQSRESGKRQHDAIDIMAPLGTPVVAAAGGRVEKLFVSAEGGNTVYVRSPDRRTLFYYAHLQGYAPGLAEGQQIARGAPIGTVGFTGNASPDGPHLHFAMYDMAPDGRWSAPLAALNPYPALVAGLY